MRSDGTAIAPADAGRNRTRAVTVGCDTGPVLAVAGRFVHTSLHTTVGALLDGGPLAVTPCDRQPLQLPAGMQEEITLYFADQDLDGLFAKSMGRIAHLMQAVAHVQGYLDGMGQPLQAVSGEMHELVAGSFLSPIWLTTAQHLAAGHDIGPGELADVPLRRDIHNAFATFGLQLREEDGDVWVDVQPIARPETLH